MKKEEVLKEIKKATAWVKTWPEWKQNILVHSGQASVTTPRKIVYKFPSLLKFGGT